jgi:hypothetical protein
MGWAIFLQAHQVTLFLTRTGIMHDRLMFLTPLDGATNMVTKILK